MHVARCRRRCADNTSVAATLRLFSFGSRQYSRILVSRGNAMSTVILDIHLRFLDEALCLGHSADVETTDRQNEPE